MSDGLRVDGATSVLATPDKLRATAPVAPPAAGPRSNAAAPDVPNLRLHTDLALNRLVLQFFDAAGTLTSQIPNQKQLDAYRLAAESGTTPQPDPGA